MRNFTFLAFTALFLILHSGCMTSDSAPLQSSGTTSEATSGGTTPNSAGSGGGSGGSSPSGSSSVRISWNAAAGSPTGYTVEQSTNGVTYAAAATSSLTSTSATVTGLASGTKYYFRVQAYNSVGSSGFSAVVTASIP